MEEPNDERLEVILRLHQVLEDFQAVSSELRDVLAIMTSWHESGVIAASPLGWPHEESLKRDIRKWLEDTVGPEGEDHPERSRTFIARGRRCASRPGTCWTTSGRCPPAGQPRVRAARMVSARVS